MVDAGEAPFDDLLAQRLSLLFGQFAVFVGEYLLGREHLLEEIAPEPGELDFPLRQ